MENNSVGKSDSASERTVPNLMPAGLPYPSNVTMNPAMISYPTQPSLSSPLADGSSSGQSGTPGPNYLVPPSMTSPSSCLTTQQMYSNYPSPYTYRSMQGGYYGSILPPGHHSSAFYGSFYNPNSSYPGGGQAALNPYYSPSLYMQNHETMWSSSGNNAPNKRSFSSYESGSNSEQPPSCSKMSSVPDSTLPSAPTVNTIPEEPSMQPSEVLTAETAVSQDLQQQHPPSAGFESKADETIESVEEESVVEKESEEEDDEEEVDQEEADEEEVEEEEEEESSSNSYESSSSPSSYTESFISDEDLPPIHSHDDHDLLHSVPESILNDTSFGDMDHVAKEDLVDAELQCLLCNNFDHLIPRLDIAVKLEPVVGEPISKSSVLLCTQCDLMLERYLSLEKEVQSLQIQIQDMYQSNKQLGQQGNNKDTEFCQDEQHNHQEDVCLNEAQVTSLEVLDPVLAPTATVDASFEQRPPVQQDSTMPAPATNSQAPPESAKAHTCNDCGKHFSTQRGLQHHMKTHEAVKTQEYRCEVCGETFTSLTLRKAHRRAVHPESASGPFQCQECSRQFDRRSNYVYHLKVHHGPREFQCSICNKAFISRAALTTHSRIHSGEKPFVCSTCGRGFNVNSNLLAHIPKCTGQLPFKCDQCSKAFGSRSLFQIHVKTHQGEYAMKCDTCGMGFVKKSHLIAHQRTHTKEKPYQCPVCGKAFASLGNCNSHAKTHADERQFVCEICGSKFARKQALETHLNRHTGAKPYNCDRCDKRFHDASNLSNHKKTHRTTE